ncbi:MAG: imidazolonepropionase-like domain-containing protein, partial [Streptosporangiales bacterium]
MPDTIYAGARVTTLFAACPYADSVLVRGERIVAVGTRAECREAARAGHREVDLDG